MSQAMRHNQGKPQYSLLDLTALEPCARVLEFGAKKYARDNWKKGMPVTKILDSLLRHIAALRSGELIDPESGLPHIGHIQCNALFLGNPKNEQDVTLDITICDLKNNLNMSTATKEILEQLEADDIAAMGIRPPRESDGVIKLSAEESKRILGLLDDETN